MARSYAGSKLLKIAKETQGRILTEVLVLICYNNKQFYNSAQVLYNDNQIKLQ